MRRWLVCWFVVLCLVGVTYAEPPPAFVHGPGFLADVKVFRAAGGGTIEIYLYLVPTASGALGVVGKLTDHTVIFYDAEPANESAPTYIDRAFCPRAGDIFPTGAKASGDFIEWATCPKRTAI